MNVHHLNCGTMCPFSRRLVNGDGPWLAPGELVCHCLLLETDRGLVLVDTGFGLADVRDTASRLGPIRHVIRPRFNEAETAIEQVRGLGFDPEDVRHIVLTHLDVDHAGGLSDFPWATVHLLAAEKHSAVDAPNAIAKRRYREAQWRHGPKWAPYEPTGQSWRGFECVRDLDGLPPELLLVPLLGHTLGHAAIAVKTDDGWMLHCGDAYFARASIEAGGRPPAGLRVFQRAAAFRYEAMLANQARLRELHTADPELTMFCAHDPAELAALRRSVPVDGL